MLPFIAAAIDAKVKSLPICDGPNGRSYVSIGRKYLRFYPGKEREHEAEMILSLAIKYASEQSILHRDILLPSNAVQ